MDFKKLGATWQGAIRANQILLVSNAALGIAVCLLAVKLAQTHERIVVVPPTVNSKYELDWHGASEKYYQDIGIWLSGTLGSVSRSNVDYVTEVINRFMDPAVAKTVVQKVQEYAFDPSISQSNAVAWFNTKAVTWEEPTSTVFVAGEINTQMNASVATSKEVVFQYTVTMKDGMPYVTAFTSYPGHDPHTAKWLRLKKEKEAEMTDAEKEAEKKAQEAAANGENNAR